MDWKLGRVITLLTMVSAGPISAQDKAPMEYGSVTLYGVAHEPCGAYVEARRLPSSAAAYGYKQFIGGYLTAYGSANMKDYPTSLAGIEGWLENYCQAHPETDFFFALAAYTKSH